VKVVRRKHSPVSLARADLEAFCEIGAVADVNRGYGVHFKRVVGAWKVKALIGGAEVIDSDVERHRGMAVVSMGLHAKIEAPIVEHGLSSRALIRGARTRTRSTPNTTSGPCDRVNCGTQGTPAIAASRKPLASWSLDWSSPSTRPVSMCRSCATASSETRS